MSGLAVRYDVSTVPMQGGYIAKQCPVRAQNNILEPTTRSVASQAAERRMARGRAFETEVFTTLADLPGAVLVDRAATTDERASATLAAMSEGARLVIGGRLPGDPEARRVGEPDLLIRQADGFVPVDVKHHRTLDPRPEKKVPATCSELDDPSPDVRMPDASSTIRMHREDLLQLAHYHRMLETLGLATSTLGGIIGVERRVVWYDLAEPVIRTRATSDPKRKQKVRSPLEVYDFEFGFRLDIIAIAARHRDDPSVDLLVVPAKSGECDDCVWWSACGPVLETPPGDVTLVPRLGWEHRRLHVEHGVNDRRDLAALDTFTAGLVEEVDLDRVLEAAATAASDTPLADLMRRTPKQAEVMADAGLVTVADLTRLDLKTAAYPAKTKLVEYIDQARAALGPSPAYRRRYVDHIVVPRAEVEVDVDMENSEEGVYLWGALVTDAGSTVYRPFTSWLPWTIEREQALLAEFWRWMLSLRRDAKARGATFRAYCYSEAAENYRLRVASVDTELEAEIETFIASSEWIDLRPIVEKSIITGGSTGLKRVAPLAGFHWSADDAGGDQSMVLYDIAAGDTADAADARLWLLRYNEDDCRATAALRVWLEGAAGRLPCIDDIGQDDLVT